MPEEQEDPLPPKVIGYEDQRKTLDIALSTGAKFILIEGELGSGKTTVMREALLKYPGIRIRVGDEAHLTSEVKRTLAREGLLERILNSLRGARQFDVFHFLESYRKPLVVCFDENRNIEEILLDVKNVISDNPKLQAIVAFTPSQKKLLEKYPEVAKRFSATAHIVLGGLNDVEKDEFIKLYAIMPFSDGAIEFVKRYDYPQDILDAIGSLQRQAKKQDMEQVDETLIRDYKPQTQVVVPKPKDEGLASGMTPLAQEVLKLIEEHKETGITPAELAEKLKTSPGTVYVKLNELKKEKLIFKSGRKMYPYFPKKPEGLGA